MDRKYYAECIVAGMEQYLRTLALLDNMHCHIGDIEWISPLPNHAGPSLVYKITLEESTAVHRIDDILPCIKTGVVPSFWFISPTSTPKNIVDILLSRGFIDLSDPENPELGMALDMEVIQAWPAINQKYEVRRVQSLSELSLWIDVVNEALHGWPMLNTNHSYSLFSRDEISLFLTYLNGTPIATTATIQDGDKASLEFVSTLKQYRNQGAATAACIESLRELQRKDVKTVTLRAEGKAVSLYQKQGFKPYFKTTALFYPTN